MSLAASASVATRIAPARARTAAPRRAVAPLRVVASASASGQKIAVLGGTGFVGSRVVDVLSKAGADVFSVSKSGGGPGGVALDLSDPASSGALAEALQGVDAVVSCVGFNPFGGDEAMSLAVNGDANAAAAAAAAKAGAKRFVYVSVASVVAEVLGDANLMTGYFEGKKRAEDAVERAFPESNAKLIVKPSFVYGGDAFGVNPPRVTQQYGEILTKLLGASLVKKVAEKSPGPIKLTLAEPVAVDDVARACAAGAIGDADGVADGADAIKACAARMA